MDFEIVFPSVRVERAFEKMLKKIPVDYRTTIAEKIRTLSLDPWPEGKRYKKLKGDEIVASHFIAQYRLRVGPFRILYDVDVQRKKIILLKLLKRDEHTYR